MSSAHVLIVEDNPRIGARLAMVLGRSGFVTTLAADGQAALAAFVRDRPDLVLAEDLVPRVDGHLVDRLRALDDEVPIVVMSGSPRVQRRLLEAGPGLAQGFLLKPFRVPDLLLAMAQALGAREAAPPAAAPATHEGLLGEDATLATLVVALVTEGATGHLRMEKDGVQRTLYFVKGLPVFAESNLLSETFGRYLAKRGVISDVQYVEVQRHMLNHDVRQGEALVALGILGNHEVYALLRGQVRERVARCFDWPGAHYTFHPDTSFVDDKLMFPMNPISLLVEGTHRRYAAPELRVWFEEHADHRIRLTAEAEPLLGYVERLQREPPILAALEAVPTLRGLGEHLQLVETRVAAMVRTLAELHVVDIGVNLQAQPSLAPLDAEATVPGSPLFDLDVGWSAPEAPAPARPPADAVAERVFAKYLETRGGSHFAVLGIGPTADQGEVERAWLTISRAFHPDAFADHPDPEVRERAKEVFVRAGIAFGALADEVGRAGARDEIERRRGAAMRERLMAEERFAAGEALLGRGDVLGARGCFAQAHASRSDEPLYEMYLGWAIFLCAETEAVRREGEALVRRAVARDPASPAGQALLARILTRVGEGEAAARAGARAAHLEDRGRGPAASS